LLRRRTAHRLYVRSDGRLDRVPPLDSANAVFCSAACSRRTGSRVDLVRRLGFVTRSGGSVADDWPSMAALRVSRRYQTALRHVWNDAMRHPILSGPFSCRVRMEPACLRGAMRRNCVRCICGGHALVARTACADLFFERSFKEILACLNHLSARIKLELSTVALAQFLEA
jgi:hypothetical protein